MTVNVHYPPLAPTVSARSGGPSIFLAGTIDMGNSVDWQGQVIAALQIAGRPVDVFNPRRANWDSSWEQSIENEQFRNQVQWELFHIEQANIVVFHFEADSLSPITLMELGLVAANGIWSPTQDVIVSCPPGYWRRGNVEIVVDRYGLHMVDSLDELVREIGLAVERAA